MADVKEPFSWPNSSLSMSSLGMAAQFTSTNGIALRLLSWWRLRATSSLPEPLGPITSTRASVGATLEIISRICCIGSDSPIMSAP